MSEQRRERIRNVAIIAHVDHGKTTLVDAMLKQTGVFRNHEAITERVLDSNELERERGITILAKHTSIQWKGHQINIIDTPGHADFGGEVERTLKMADGALLLVDAAEGPLPQTRFVLSKAIELGLSIVVVINKIDRSDARPQETLNETFDLFCDLGASDAQSNFATLYAIGKAGIASRDLDHRGSNLEPLFEAIINSVPAPEGNVEGELRALVHNIEHDEYVGRLAICRIRQGQLAPGQAVRLFQGHRTVTGKLGPVFGFQALSRVRLDKASAGEIVAVAGLEDVTIGDTIAALSAEVALPRIAVEEPTIKIGFSVNDSPFAGRSGKWVTSRHLRERLFREAQRNLAMRVEETDSPDTFLVHGRGELMISILAETMRREGYEFSLGMPEVVTREIDGQLYEPVELVVVDVPEEFVGAVTRLLGEQRGRMEKMQALGPGRTRLEYRVPSRGLIGFRSRFLTETRGAGLLNTLFDAWEPAGSQTLRRTTGSIVADRQGRATPYALFHLQPRGVLFIEPGIDVYEGMVVGESNRQNNLEVNVTREKKLTNIRAAGRDENIILTPPRPVNIERGLDYIDRDELVEVTPNAVRLRKRVLLSRDRPRRREAAEL